MALLTRYQKKSKIVLAPVLLLVLYCSHREPMEGLEMMELNGSEKQVAWAQDIRNNMIKDVEDALAYFFRLSADGTVANEQIEIAKQTVANTIEFLSNKTSAKWFIDNRDRGVKSLNQMAFNELHK